jgi:osmoprotectant transport system permease protein
MIIESLREQLPLLPVNLAHHLMVSVVALVIGVALSVPLGVLLVRRRSLRGPVLGSVSVIQTVPSLAMLALMVPLLLGVGWAVEQALGVRFSALGFWPTVIALTLYSMLPVVRNTVTGLEGVDPAVREAAQGVGMTPRQSLWRVEMPLAFPVIIGGIRTATVWVVGIATLATPVGQRCLGDFIFRGLQTRNWTMVLLGCVAAAGLAILLDGLLAQIELGVTRRRRVRALAASLALCGVIASGLVLPSMLPAGTSAALPRAVEVTRIMDRPVRIGAKTFTEQYILAALLERRLQQAGYRTERREGLGSTVAFDALAGGEIDLYVDYSGTIWSTLMGMQGTLPRDRVLSAVTWWLASRHGIRCLGSLGFENAYALAMRRGPDGRGTTHAGRGASGVSIRSIDDLVPLARTMTMAGDHEFFARSEWRDVRDAYGIDFGDLRTFDATFMYGAVADGEVDVIAAFSSDGRIAAYGLTTLEDTLRVLPPYDAMLLLAPDVAADPHLVATLEPLLGAIDVETMRQANHSVDRDDEERRTISQAASWLAERIENRATDRGKN